MAEAVLDKDASIQLCRLTQLIQKKDGYSACLAALNNQSSVLFDGAWGSACALVAASLHESANKKTPDAGNSHPILIVCDTEKKVDDFCDDFETFAQRIPKRFPFAPSNKIETAEEDVSMPTINVELGQRLSLLKDLTHSISDSTAKSNSVPPVMITSISGLMQKCPNTESIDAGSRRLSVGETLDVEQLKIWLTENGFHHSSGVELPSEFSVRGGIIDIFSIDWERPCRIELFGDEIDSIREFDIESQRSAQKRDSIEITVLNSDSPVELTLLDLLPDSTWIVLVNIESLHNESQQLLKLVTNPERFASFSELQKHFPKFGVAQIESLASGHVDVACQIKSEATGTFDGDVGDIRAKIDQVGKDHQVYIVPRIVGEIERLNEILNSTHLGSQGRLHYPVGCVHEAFRLIDDQVLVVGVDQLFRKGEMRRTARRRLGKSIDSFLDLREGDLVVHLTHGIARYRGLKVLNKDGRTTEHLELEFHGQTKIYVPASKIGLVQKYIGGSKRKPTLGRIGGKSWLKQKKAAESAVTDLASEMLEVQASRALRTGIPFSADGDWQHEFERSFPYRETEDQNAAIRDIKQDMTRPRPMDRLLCGDVGFGKTEVAMRAAFKAVESGYQVAVMCPTTILCEQHFKSFSQRMSQFPFEIGKLSRFCSTREIRETIEGLKKGSIDIAIGTHRIASKDVGFYNLGLVIIDEEQKFGVEVKERLKKFRSSVDILTMSATPIPRTLHMSLVGVRDISNLETPPEQRVGVETRVTRFDESVIRQAVLRELSRGGQTYFVHNRVNDIHIVRDNLQRIVPEASICVGHGQMHEDELCSVMLDFIEGRYDILLATTIVENGLDIPNANTIFIDEADRYGLSDLHQLRGRVGRYRNQAYCYLLVDPNKYLNATAAKRLHAIQEYSQMGAGFAISMRDLEIRGAGNLLGTEQSGHIAAVGYELYCQLLESAVRELKKLPQKISVDVEIDIPCDAYLPDEFVTDKRAKIDFYRRLSRIDMFDQVDQLKEELEDRFGPIPVEAQRMFKLARLRLQSAFWLIRSIHLEDHYLVFRYSDKNRIQQLVKLSEGKLRIVDNESAYVTLKKGPIKSSQLLQAVQSILQPKS